MASPSTPDSLTEVLRRLADRLDDLEDRLDRIKGNQAAFTIAATAPFADTVRGHLMSTPPSAFSAPSAFSVASSAPPLLYIPPHRR